MEERSEFDSEPDNLFEVKTINGKRINNGVEEYLVEWVGYSEMTWEPKEHLENIAYMINQYEKNMKKKAETSMIKEKGTSKIREEGQFAGEMYTKERRLKMKAGVSDDFSDSLSDSSVELKAKKVKAPKANQSLRDFGPRPEEGMSSFMDYGPRPLLGKFGLGGPGQLKTGQANGKTIEIGEDGSFEKGDKVLRIFEWWLDKGDGKSRSFRIMFIVEWKKRGKRLKPRPSIVDHFQMREGAPEILLDFYESKISVGFGPEVY
jgi:Chromo (CHRromatin Organisation MOdifier) domain/Chromo shadow domain